MFTGRNWSTSTLLAKILLVYQGVWSIALAQEPVVNDLDRKIVEIVRVERAPVIDGRLDDDMWSQAAIVDDLHEIIPNEYAEPSQHTEVRLLHDGNALYVAARLWDSEADRITAQVLRQGERLGNEDRFAIILDPFLDRRSGYKFQLNPNAVRYEALYQNVSTLEPNWEGIWRGSATRDDEGWTAEMAIPFKTLSFNPNNDRWGINFQRTIQRDGQLIGWVSRNQGQDPSTGGIATGLSGVEQGLGLDVVPSVSLSERKQYSPSDSRFNMEPSLDIFYKMTSALNASLTLNTDFSATEIDDRQVNLTRFGLFFPEKRDFFLQDADIFQFGRIGASSEGNEAIPSAARQNGRPFFSRRVGLSNSGQPVDLNYGAKVSGRVGRWNMGALAIEQDAFSDVDATHLLAGRAAVNVLEESSVGVIVTDGDPRSNLDTTLIGADFNYRNSRLPGGRLIQADAWYQQTDAEGRGGDDRAFGVGLDSPNSTGWRGGLKYQELQENFDPALGFVTRTGIRDYALDIGYTRRYRNAYLRSLYGGVDLYRVERLDARELESEIISLRALELENNTRDTFWLRYTTRKENLTEGFEIYTAADGSGAITISPGQYSFSEYRFNLGTGSQRRISGSLQYAEGDFFSGNRSNIRAGVTWRPSKHFWIDTSYDFNDIKLPEGNFVTRLVRVRTEIVFSATLSWANMIQYDNVSETIGVNSRLHWIPEAGREGFIVLNHNMADEDRDNSFQSTLSDISMKLAYTWRF